MNVIKYFSNGSRLLILVSIVTLISGWIISPLAKNISTEILFRKSQKTLGDIRTFGIAIADVDMDGDNDVFTTNYIGPSKLWLNDGNGNFTESVQNFGNSEAHAVAIADLNSDGFPDIFLLNHAAPCKVFFNDGKGNFKDSGQNIGSVGDNPGMVVPGDVDNDGDLDAFISYYQLPNRLWLNDGKGFFKVTDTLFGGAEASDMALVDVNGDKFLDLFLTLTDKPDEIWMNDGKGKYNNSGQKLGNSKGYEKVDCGDINGDGYTDFVTSNSVGGIIIWLNQKNTGIFNEAGPYFEPAFNVCKLLDADNDNDLDLIIASRTGTKILLNDGKGNFTLGQVFDETWVARIACGKLDMNNTVDFVLGKKEGTGGNSIYFNETGK